MSRINLGNLARDVMTGFEGHVVARTDWLHGCSRFGLEPAKLDKDGCVRKTEWFDEQRVELVKAFSVVDTTRSGGTGPGGPRDDPSR